MANASSIAHRLPTKTGQLQSFRCRTQTKYASAAAAQALLHRSRPSSTPSSPSRRLLACRPGARARVRVRPAGKPVGGASRPQGVQGGCTAASRARSPGRARLLDAHRRPLQAATPDPGLPAWSLDHLRRAVHLRGGGLCQATAPVRRRLGPLKCLFLPERWLEHQPVRRGGMCPLA